MTASNSSLLLNDLEQQVICLDQCANYHRVAAQVCCACCKAVTKFFASSVVLQMSAMERWPLFFMVLYVCAIMSALKFSHNKIAAESHAVQRARQVANPRPFSIKFDWPRP